MNEPNDTLDESTLRRALRLEPDEVPARLDARIFAVERRETSLPPVASGVVAGAAGVLTVAALLSLVPDLGDHAFEVSLSLFAAAAARVLEIAQQPSVPLGVIAVLVMAIVLQLGERKELVHVGAS